MEENIRVAKKYSVEYGETRGFHDKTGVFHDLLDALGGEPNYCNYGGIYEDFFNCRTEDYDDAIQNLMVYISDPTLLTESDLIKDALDEAGMTAEEALDLMRRYQQEADTSDGCLHFYVF